MRLALSLIAAVLAASAAAGPSNMPITPITLDLAMSHPDWIGTPVEQAWWGWDSGQIYYRQKRVGSPLRDTFVIGGGKTRHVDEIGLAQADTAQLVRRADGARALFVRNGDLFERDMKNGALTQLTRSQADEADPQYAANGTDVQFRIGTDWFEWRRAERLVSPLALLRAAKDPDAAPEDDALRAMQLRLIATLQRMKDERDARQSQSKHERAIDPTRAATPVYLGDKIEINSSSLSPDGRSLLVLTTPKGSAGGRVGKMPKYVTESGYEETSDERTRVGQNVPVTQTLSLIDLATGTVSVLAVDSLPGIDVDPLADLRAAQKLPAHKGNRGVRYDVDGDAPVIRWSADGKQVALMVRAIDNKDRWMVGVDLAAAKLKPLHRLTDRAWIEHSHNEFGWLPDRRTLWFLSEETGYSHLYTMDANGRVQPISSGKWEATGVQWSHDGGTAWFMCNIRTPVAWEVCKVSRNGGAVRALTAVGGIEDFDLSPDGKTLLVRHSSSYSPPQLAKLASDGGAVVSLTDTRSAAFRERNWIAPQIVAVPSTHGAAPIWSKLYRPVTLEAGKQYPIVLFVHGAGYLQNSSWRYPVYFREQMFHNLLVEKGYIVLDMDYRGSKGYGRDWRSAIYRQMGHPELEDYQDGLRWLVAEHQGDPGNVGIYGGSYGGFMTLMALLRAPDQFKTGAALRSVTDWTTYNHDYTSNILNTPELDPQAYRTSSPIEYAQHLRGNLLLAHGMIDDNVFYQDSVRFAQRLIELKKENWEFASYPLERHGFVHAESWYDEYRRIFQLFERTLKK